MLNRWAKIEKTTQKNPLRGIQWIFFAYALLTLFWCPNKGHGLFQLMVLLANFMLYTIVLYSITDEKTHRNIMWWWVIWGTIQSLAVYSFYFFHSLDLFYIGKVVEGINLSIFVPTGHYMGSRVIRRGEAFATPLETVLIMNLVFSIALGLFLTESRKWKRYLLIGIMIQIISIVLLTMSRAGLFSFFVMGFTMFLLIRRLRERFVAGFSLFLLILVTVFVIQHSLLNLLFKYTFIPPRIGLGYVTKSTGTMMPAFAGQRVRFWKWGYNILQESSFLGGGIGSYKYFTRAPHAHSLYLSFLFDFGWVGFILILSIMIVLLRRFLKWIKFQSSYLQCLAASFFGGMIAMGVHGAVDFEYNRPIPWLYIGMATATLNLLEREEQA
jgi:O-antigen ligase